MELLKGLEVLCHSSIRISNGKTIYFDPFKVDKEYNDADYIFCTHTHYDHFSIKDIKKVMNKNTIIIIPSDVKSELSLIGIDQKNIVVVKPNEEYKIGNIIFQTVVAYNKRKLFHPQKKGWVGYIVLSNKVRYYVAGDTDSLPELENIKCDVALLPVGGMYTMNYKNAAELVNKIKPKVAIPTHYGSVIGSIKDAESFVELIDDKIDTKILLKPKKEDE